MILKTRPLLYSNILYIVPRFCIHEPLVITIRNEKNKSKSIGTRCYN